MKGGRYKRQNRILRVLPLLRLQQLHQTYGRVRKARATARYQIERARQLELADADFGQLFSFYFPADAHSRHDRYAHAHLHEAFDAFDRGHFDVAVQRRVVFFEELNDARAVGRIDVVRDERFLAQFLDVH